MHAVRKYLAKWAEPETALAGSVDARYDRCLVVPACRERGALLDGYLGAARSSPGRTLCILVVNGREDASASHHAENAALLDELRAALHGSRFLPHGGAFLGATTESALDVLVVDRASAGHRLPPKAGVGLARKIGMDLALGLYVAGKVTSPVIFCTDADVTLPASHFERPGLDAPGVAAHVFPFWHVPSGDADVTRATALYELSLRYYVAGLAFAGSPYAFHTLGSAMAVDAASYAAVRGTPRREAGEDFYLLGKLAKVGRVARAGGPTVRIQSRASDRTPFGTGAGVAQGLSSATAAFYAPEVFVALARFLRALDDVARSGEVARLHDENAGLRPEEWEAARRALLVSSGRESLDAAVRDAPSSEARRVRLHEWFDSFRTLKFIHALRDGAWPSVPRGAALTRAPFTPAFDGLLDETQEGDRLIDGVRAAFASAEVDAATFLGRARSRPPSVISRERP